MRYAEMASFRNQEIAVETDGPLSDKSRRAIATPAHLRQVLHRWWWNSRLRILLPEFRSLLGHIRLVLEIHVWERRGLAGPLPSAFGWLEAVWTRQRRRAHMDYMQQIHDRYPFLSTIDVAIADQSWRAGAAWRDRIDSEHNQKNIDPSSPAPSHLEPNRPWMSP